MSQLVLHDAAAVSLPPEVSVHAVYALYTILSKGQLCLSLLSLEQCSRPRSTSRDLDLGWDLAKLLERQSRDSPGSILSILWNSGFWGAADVAVLIKVHKKFSLSFAKYQLKLTCHRWQSVGIFSVKVGRLSDLKRVRNAHRWALKRWNHRFFLKRWFFLDNFIFL